MSASSATEEVISQALTVKQIISLVNNSRTEYPLSFSLSKRLRENKISLIQKLLHEGPYWEGILSDAVLHAEVQDLSKRQARRTRGAELQRSSRQTARERREQTAGQVLSNFLEPASEAQVHARYKEFYDSTSNDALQTRICAVCARSLNVQKAQVVAERLENLPNLERLRPQVTHESHVLTKGYLLERAGCTEDDEGWQVNICGECHKDLKVSAY